MARIYLASSWRNLLQPEVVVALRAAGHSVYDFRNPPDAKRGEMIGDRGTGSGFQWSEVDPGWKGWSGVDFRKGLGRPISRRGYESDLNGMLWADTCVLLLPCGRSAHLEAGWMKGQGKRLIIWTRDGEEPELMYLLADAICLSLDEILALLERWR